MPKYAQELNVFISKAYIPSIYIARLNLGQRELGFINIINRVMSSAHTYKIHIVNSSYFLNIRRTP